MNARKIGLAALAALAPVVALGQDAGAPQQPDSSSTNHLTMERIRNGFVVAPDNRFTDVDGQFGNVLGVYGGWMMDRTILIGAGGYWLTNGSHTRDMSYGGAVFEWLYHGDQRLGLNTRVLIGGGSASLPGPVVTIPVPTPRPTPLPSGGMPGHGPDGAFGMPWFGAPWPTTPTSFNTRLHDGFFVAEPQVNVSWSFARWLHVTAGGGYRWVEGAHDMDSRLRGVSGSLALQIGGGS